MIPFDFEYYKPTKLDEAIQVFQSLLKQEKRISYYSGGTEFITFARLNKIVSDAVIDIKGISECKMLKVQGDQLVIGAAVPLNKVTESNVFPLLGEKLKQVADHTSRNKITIGGNIKSQLIYREGILPLLLADAKVRVAGSEGIFTTSLSEVFHGEIEIDEGDLLVQFLVDEEFVNVPYVNIKKTKSTKVGYPIVSVSALVKDKKIRIAFSGICEFPFRLTEIEDVLNDHSLSREEKVNEVIIHLPTPIVDDLLGSSNYRKFVLKNTLLETMEALEEYVK